MGFRKKSKNIRRKEPLTRKVKKTLALKSVVHILRTGLYMLFAVFIGVGAWHLYQGLLKNPYLAIKEITVVGNIKVSRAEVVELAGVDVGDNLLAIQATDIKNSIRANRWVADVNITRNFPDRLRIGIRERRPIAFINLDSLYFVDESGIIFKKTSLEDDVDLPIITGLTREDITEEGRESELAVKAVNLIHLLAKKGTLANEELSEINIDKTYGLTLYTMQEGTRIEIGDGDFAEKLERLEKVMQSRNGLAGVEFIGLNTNKGVVVRLASIEPKKDRSQGVAWSRGHEVRLDTRTQEPRIPVSISYKAGGRKYGKKG